MRAICRSTARLLALPDKYRGAYSMTVPNVLRRSSASRKVLLAQRVLALGDKRKPWDSYIIAKQTRR